MDAAAHPIAGPTHRLARQLGTPRATPPMQLLSGEIGFIVMTPLGTNSVLAGSTLGAAFTSKILLDQAVLPEFKSGRYDLSISGNGFELYRYGDLPSAGPTAAEARVKVLDQEWVVHLAQTATTSGFKIWLLIAGAAVVLSALFSILLRAGILWRQALLASHEVLRIGSERERPSLLRRTKTSKPQQPMPNTQAVQNPSFSRTPATNFAPRSTQ